MKTAPAPLVTFINASNVFTVADLWDFYLADGTNLRWTDADRPVTYPTTGTVITDLDGDPAPGTFEPTVGIERDGVHWTAAPEVQGLGVTLMVTETDLYNGAPMAQRAREGLFDGARVKLYRAFFSTDGALVDCLLHFEGTAADVQPTSSSIRLNIKSELDRLNIQLPKHLFQPNCSHAFLDAGCDPAGTLRTSVTSTGSLVGVPSTTQAAISGSYATNFFQLGVIRFTSGVCTGLRRTIRDDVGSGPHVLTFTVRLPQAPAAGDTYSLIQGCPRTKAACEAFSNQSRFRGFLYIPRPEDIR